MVVHGGLGWSFTVAYEREAAGVAAGSNRPNSNAVAPLTVQVSLDASSRKVYTLHSTRLQKGHASRPDSCATQLKAQGPSRACNESKEEEEASFRKVTPHARSPSTRDRLSSSVQAPLLSDTIYLLICFRKSTPPQNRRLNLLIGNSKQ